MKAFYSFFVVVVAVVLVAGCGKSSKNAATIIVPDTPVSNVITLNQALQTFNTQEGHYPKTLDELVPKYIAKIPDAPAGFKMTYNPATGQVKTSR